MNGQVNTHTETVLLLRVKKKFSYLKIFCIKWKPEVTARMASRYIPIQQRLKMRSMSYILLIINLPHIHIDKCGGD